MIPTAAANWTRSPADTGCLFRKGARFATTPSRPMLAAKAVSMSAKVMIDPSAPPPKVVLDLEKPMASLKARRRTPCTFEDIAGQAW